MQQGPSGTARLTQTRAMPTFDLTYTAIVIVGLIAGVLASFVMGGVVDSTRGDFRGNRKGAFMYMDNNKHGKSALIGSGNLGLEIEAPRRFKNAVQSSR